MRRLSSLVIVEDLRGPPKDVPSVLLRVSMFSVLLQWTMGDHADCFAEGRTNSNHSQNSSAGNGF